MIVKAERAQRRAVVVFSRGRLEPDDLVSLQIAVDLVGSGQCVDIAADRFGGTAAESSARGPILASAAGPQ